MTNHTITNLLTIMERLRNPENGCPWDIEQDFHSIASCTLEEAYEVVDAIEYGDREQLKNELGDLMFQAVFYAQMAKEEGSFTWDDVIHTICQKLIDRHPHIFGDASIETAAEQEASWEALKAAEREEKAKRLGTTPGILDDIPKGFPALSRAVKLQKRAAKVGFDWPAVDDVFVKIEEELAELKEAMEKGDMSHIKEEYGDLLFCIANIARHLNIDPETALRACNAKFEQRFNFVENKQRMSGKQWEHTSLEEMEKWWQESKRAN